MSDRSQNIIFVLLLAVILAVTAYAMHVRVPSMGFDQYRINIPREASSKESSNKKKTKIEKMIEAGELSDHEAKYYRVLSK